MMNDDAVVNPGKGKNSPELGPVAVMVCGPNDLKHFCSLMNISREDSVSIVMSRLYSGKSCPDNISVVGPVFGAPYAALLLEDLIAWGARKIIMFGWCGAVSPDVNVGDIVIPSGAFVDEGTSVHYNQESGSVVQASDAINKKIKDLLEENNFSFHEGNVWTTDAIYRETREKVLYFQKQGVLGVDMEASAFFSIGKFRRVETAAILVVSDDISTLTWQPGFSSKRFKSGCRDVAGVIQKLCRML